MIIGLAGKAGSGKDLFAELIKKRLTSVENLAFAKPIKDAAKILFNFTDDQLYNYIKKEEIDPIWDKSPRQIFQLLGGMLRKDVHENFFIMNIKQKIESSNANVIVITDVRFINELEFIRSIGGKIIKILRPNAITTEHCDDISEQGISNELADVIIINDGTIEEFEDKIMELLKIF
jgi:hypothetical protein